MFSMMAAKQNFHSNYHDILYIYIYNLILTELAVKCTRYLGRYFTLVQLGNPGSEDEGRCLILPVFSVPSSSRSFSFALLFFLFCKLVKFT